MHGDRHHAGRRIKRSICRIVAPIFKLRPTAIIARPRHRVHFRRSDRGGDDLAGYRLLVDGIAAIGVGNATGSAGDGVIRAVADTKVFQTPLDVVDGALVIPRAVITGPAIAAVGEVRDHTTVSVIAVGVASTAADSGGGHQHTAGGGVAVLPLRPRCGGQRVIERSARRGVHRAEFAHLRHGKIEGHGRDAGAQPIGEAGKRAGLALGIGRCGLVTTQHPVEQARERVSLGSAGGEDVGVGAVCRRIGRHRARVCHTGRDQRATATGHHAGLGFRCRANAARRCPRITIAGDVAIIGGRVGADVSGKARDSGHAGRARSGAAIDAGIRRDAGIGRAGGANRDGLDAACDRGLRRPCINAGILAGAVAGAVARRADDGAIRPLHDAAKDVCVARGEAAIGHVRDHPAVCATGEPVGDVGGPGAHGI